MSHRSEPGYDPERGPVQRRGAAPTAGRPPEQGLSGMMLHLQRTVGNQAVSALLQRDTRRVAPAPSAAQDVRSAHFEIDSDGDQRNDLELTIRASATLWLDHALDAAFGLPTVAALDRTPVSVEITQLPSLTTRRLEFDWSSPSARLFPGVLALTDGKGPTTILLTPDAGQQLLMIYPPTSTADGLHYHVEAAGQSLSFTLPLPTMPTEDPRAAVATAGAVSTMPGYQDAVDIILGDHADAFRLTLTVSPTTLDKALFAIAALHDSGSRGSAPAPVTLSGPLSLRVIDAGPVSLGLDLDGDDKPEIQIFDQLETIDGPDASSAGANGPAGAGEERRHVVRASGSALGADALFPFTVRGHVVSSAMLAIGGVTALDLPLGPFGDMFRPTLQPTAPDRAIFGISSSDPSSLKEGLGAEIALSGPFSVRLIDIGPASVGLDLNGDDKAELEIVDQVDYWEADEAPLHNDSERSHTVWVTGPAVGMGHDLTPSFVVRNGRLLPGSSSAVLDDPNEVDKAAAANALTVASLAEQADQGSIEQQFDAYERAQTAMRFKAASEGIIAQEAYDAWAELSRDLIALEPQINQQRTFNPWSAAALGPAEMQRQIRLHSVDPALQEAAASQAMELADRLDMEVAAPTEHSVLRLSGAIARALRTSEWDSALAGYWELVDILDGMIIQHLQAMDGPHADMAQEAESVRAHEHALRDVAAHNSKRLLAVFLPDERFRTEDGYVAEMPLTLYYWKDDGAWYLKDLTNPEKLHDPYKVDGNENDTEPPASLWDELNSDRFPVGVIRYLTPDGASGEVQTTNPLTFKKFLQYLGMGLAALSVVVAPFDAPVVAQVVALSAVAANATFAAMDLRDHLKEGDLNATTVLLDLTQIVSALAGTSALAAGRIESGSLAAFANEFYVPIMVKTAAAADAVNLATFGAQTAVQLDEIENSPGSRADKDRAKLRALAQLAVTGHLAMVHIKGLASLPGEGRIITIVPSEQGGPPVAEIAGEGGAAASHPTAAALDPETGLPPIAEPGVAGSGPTAAGAVGAPGVGMPGGADAPRRPSVLIVGAERAEEFDQARALAGQGRDVTVVNPRATEAARGYQAAGGHFHEGGIETLPQGLQYDYIREEFPQPLGRTLVGLEAVQARFRRLAPGGRLEIVTEANAEEFRRLFDVVGESEYGCSVTTRELGPAEGPHSPAYVPAGERRIETVFVRPAEPAAGSGPVPASGPGTGSPGADAPATTDVAEPPAAGHVPMSDPHAPGPAPATSASPYDPVGRTDDELVQDMNRTPRPSETPPEAMARARDAAQALYLRQTLRTYHGLGEEPPILDMRAHDAQYAANGAHTTERHGPDIPLHRTDAPRGLRTIEGRIYGDPPWDEAANWSYKGVYAQTAENSVTHIQVQHARTGNPWGVVSAWSPKRQGFPYTSRRAARAGQPCAPALSPNGCFPTLLDRPSERVAPARCVTS